MSGSVEWLRNYAKKLRSKRIQLCALTGLSTDLDESLVAGHLDAAADELERLREQVCVGAIADRLENRK